MLLSLSWSHPRTPLHWHCHNCRHPPMEHPSSRHAVPEGYGEVLRPPPQLVILVVILVLPSSSFSSFSDHHRTLPTGLLARGIDPQHCRTCPRPQEPQCCCRCRPCQLLLSLSSLPFSFACSHHLLIVASSAKQNCRCHQWHRCHRHVVVITIVVITALAIDLVEVDNGVESSLSSAPPPPPRQQIGGQRHAAKVPRLSPSMRWWLTATMACLLWRLGPQWLQPIV